MAIKPLVPFEFDGTALEFDIHAGPINNKYLQFKEIEFGHLLTWPLVGVRLIIPKYDHWPSLENVEQANPGIFKTHSLRGFTAGLYHELFVDLQYSYEYKSPLVTYKAGNVEAGFGYATPLAAFLFEVNRSKYFGSWSEINTLRILGANVDEVEAVIINVFNNYASQFKILPKLIELDDSFIYDFDDDYLKAHKPKVITIPPLTVDLEPLRFFYSGLSQSDNVAACIYFYRVLEFFSFLSHFDAIKTLRHDATVSDIDFSHKMLGFVTKDEKGPIFKLISAILENKTIVQAQSDGLIGNASPNALCEAIYAFRNSIVHGKLSYGYALQSESILDQSAVSSKWRNILRDLARVALERYGSKKI